MEGIIVRSADYKESSKILTVFTPNGFVSLIVRGCKKMNSSFISVTQNYNRISFETTDRTVKTLIDANIIDSYEDIKYDLKKNECLALIFSQIGYVNEFDEQFYSFILKILESLKYLDVYSCYIMFKIKLTYFLGIAPRFTCKCGSKTNIIDFDIMGGNVLCNKCSSLNRVDIIVLIHNLYYDKTFSTNVDKREYEKLLNFIIDYYYNHLGILIKKESNL